MKRTLLPAYFIESFDDSRPGIVERFLGAMSNLHSAMRLPCTCFVLGRALVQHPDAFRRAHESAGEWIDFQQYTFSGIPLKTVCQQNHQGVKLFRGASLDDCREDIARASEIMEHVLGARPVGLAGPLGYYRGLSDQPDVLAILDELGIRFTRTYTRNARDWSPVAFEVQPFRYDVQGYPQILEIPGQGWPDRILRETIAGKDPSRYVAHLKKDLNYVATKELVWSFSQSDWSCMVHDPEMTGSREILEYARELGFEIMSHASYAEAWTRSGGNPTAAPIEPEPDGIPSIEAEPATTDMDNDFSPAEPPTVNRWIGTHIRDLRRAGGAKTSARIRRLLRKAGSVHRHRMFHRRGGRRSGA